MGIKGRRVHIIEEMSSCVISFQRGKIFKTLLLAIIIHSKILKRVVNNHFFIYYFTKQMQSANKI